MVAEPRWIDADLLIPLHDNVIALSGGAAGLRDAGLLESALTRPQNRFSYEGETDIIVLAATYGVAVSANHPFIDGNKRAAFMALGLFLDLNGFALEVAPAKATETMYAVAAGKLDLEGLTAWLRVNVRPADPPAPAGA